MEQWKRVELDAIREELWQLIVRIDDAASFWALHRCPKSYLSLASSQLIQARDSIAEALSKGD